VPCFYLRRGELARRLYQKSLDIQECVPGNNRPLGQPHLRTCRLVQHPRREFEAAKPNVVVPSADDGGATRPALLAADDDRLPVQRVPPIPDFAQLLFVGLVSVSCTTAIGRTPAFAAGRPTRSTSVGSRRTRPRGSSPGGSTHATHGVHRRRPRSKGGMGPGSSSRSATWTTGGSSPSSRFAPPRSSGSLSACQRAATPAEGESIGIRRQYGLRIRPAGSMHPRVPGPAQSR
jgi:hypothetical protein